jgi:mono/diheme cytochrome c family protein
VLRTSLVLAHLFILSGATFAQAQSTSTASDTEMFGRKIFQTRCAMCHVGQNPATELQDGTAGQQWTFGPLLSKANAANEATLRNKIKNGGPRMPAYKLALTDTDINQVIAFMKTLEQPLTKLALEVPGE